MDELSIPSHSSHKEGAWEFLNFYLSKEDDGQNYFSTRKSILQGQAEEAVSPLYVTDSEGNPLQYDDGSYEMLTMYYVFIGSERIGAAFIPQEQVDALLMVIGETDFTPKSTEENGAVEIVAEETAYFFNGAKSLDQVVRIIQSRINMLIQSER